MPSDLTPDSLTQRIYWQYLSSVLPFLIPVVYLLTLLLGIDGDHRIQALTVAVPLVGIFFGFLPYVIIRSRTTAALAQNGSDVPGARLSRLLELPRRVELDTAYSILAGCLIFTGWAVWALDRSPTNLFVAAFLVSSLNMLLGIRFFLRVERLVQPVSLVEFHRHPSAEVSGPTLLWPRLSWYLAFAFIAILFCTLASMGTVLYAGGRDLLDNLNRELIDAGRQDIAIDLASRFSALQGDLLLPLFGLGAFMLALAALTAWQLGQRFQEASIRIREAVTALAEGSPRMPEWVATDEFGDLSRGLAGVFARLQDIATSLKQSAAQLASSAEELGGSTGKQNETLARQAAALQETEVTAQEIKQTSLLAAQKTEAVLRTAERAEEISRTGETAVEQSLEGLTGIRDEVSEMASRIRTLGERTRQIATITTTVKDLADQSNMLALNAAIEAVRSGEHGKGFAVVAREIRSLADQSIQATNRVREILEDISEAIRTTVAITDRGSEKIQTSLVQMQSSGESLRELSGIVRDNAMAVRQIAAAVGQQNAGIGQIFEAVKDLSRMMDDTLDRLRATDGAATMVRTVAVEVSDVVVRYGVSDVDDPDSKIPTATRAA